MICKRKHSSDYNQLNPKRSSAMVIDSLDEDMYAIYCGTQHKVFNDENDEGKSNVIQKRSKQSNFFDSDF